MATAKKLPSGSWRVRVYSHTDENGKVHTLSFTAPSKAEAEMKAAQFANRKTGYVRGDLTVAACLEDYITAKRAVLSPSTHTSYRSMQRRFYDSINRVKVRRLTQLVIQTWISDLSKTHSPKTVKNAYALLSSSLRFSGAQIALDGITLPTIPKKRPEAPTDAEIGNLYNEASPKLQKAIALAAFGSLRRGEVCALKYSDIIDGKIHVHADMVIDENRGWFYKDYPKTSESDRIISLPKPVLDLLGNGDPDAFVVGYTPSGLSKAYDRLKARLNTSIRFHDLRHYYASIGAVLNIPDIYLASFGGWRKDSPVMKQVYQNPITPISEGYARKMNEHFESVAINPKKSQAQ